MAYRGNYILSSDSHYTQDVEEGKTKADAINSYLEESDSHDKDTQDVEEGEAEANEAQTQRLCCHVTAVDRGVFIV